MPDQWGAFAISWQIEEPFWGRIWASLPKLFSRGVERVALQPVLSGSIQLAINPDWAGAQPEVFLRNFFRHELAHLLLGHPFRAGSFPHAALYDLAADVEVHSLLPEAQWPPDALEAAHFPDFDLPEQKGAGSHYRTLHGYWRRYMDSAENTSSHRQLFSLVHQGCPAMRSHRYWPEIALLGNGMLPWWESWTEELCRNAGESAWKAATGLWERMERSRRPPMEQWRRALGMFVAGAGRSKLENTIHRVSRRYDTTPGLRIATQRRLWVAIDTSGSVGAGSLSRFFGEIDHIWRTGAELTVLECDLAIRRRYRYTGAPPPQVLGRGGTAFDPVLTAADVERPDGLIYFTDGLAAIPRAVCRTPVLWVIDPGGVAPGQDTWRRLPGKVVRMDG